MATNVQASKEQERKALKQIKAIVESLGENSYVGTALEGCLDDAEKDRAIAKLGDKVAELVKNSISKDDLETVITLTRAGMTETGAAVEKYAAQIVELADDTCSVQFSEAVYRHRQSKSCYDGYCDLLNRLCEITPVGN